MQPSSTRLKKPLHIWLARIIGFGLVLGYTWIHIQSIQEYESRLNIGVVQDIYHLPDQTGKEIIRFVSAEAIRKGISIGDQLLNPGADSFGQVGTDVIFQIQGDNLFSKEVTFVRKHGDNAVYGGILLGMSSDVSKNLAFFLAIFLPFIFVLSAFLLCWLRSDDWMALLTAVMLVSIYGIPTQNQLIQIFRASAGLFLSFWFVLFPNGKFAPQWSWVPVLFTVPTTIISLFIDLGIIPWGSDISKVANFNTILSSVLFLVILAIMIYRYRRVFSLVERQQTKWIIIAFNVWILPVVISSLFYSNYFNSFQYEKAIVAYFINAAIGSLLTPVLVLAILFSVFKYRLYDVDFFVSRTLVYSSLTGILGVVGVVVTTLINSIPQQILGNQSGLLGVVVSALPIAALFNPVREGLQQFVDRYFKPEEVDFDNTFIEFTSELSSFFTLQELSALLSAQAMEQLAVSYASVFLKGQDGDLKRIKTTALDAEMPEPVLDPKTVATIRSGQLAKPEGDSAPSLVVPLVVPRTRKPSLMGALVLGPRSQGLGYSTEMQKSLKKFGETVGKAFYVAELKGRKKGNP